MSFVVSGALKPVAVGGHIGVALAAHLPVAVRPRWHTPAPAAAGRAGSHAQPLPRVETAPPVAEWDAICRQRRSIKEREKGLRVSNSSPKASCLRTLLHFAS